MKTALTIVMPKASKELGPNVSKMLTRLILEADEETLKRHMEGKRTSCTIDQKAAEKLANLSSTLNQPAPTIARALIELELSRTSRESKL